MASETNDSRIKIVFFLGAGASVKAKVPDTFHMVDEFLRELEPEQNLLIVVEEILRTLKDWKQKQDPRDPRVDVELLLETLEKIENRKDDVLLNFFDTKKFILEETVDISILKNKLKNFIKSKGIVKSSMINYFEPLNGFISDYKFLDIFTVNYDICIEQFCNTYLKDYTDGFDIYWNPILFKRKDIDIKLYKLHGSVMWYNTDRGDYIKLPIMTQESETELITGEKATTLILYPERKWEYTGPFLELLVELKKILEKTRFLVVVGYSFRDEHILRVFWDAARKNRELIMLFISPSSNSIYNEKLKDYEISEIKHDFTSDFSPEHFDAFFPSSLSGRVICLPYLFEEIFPRLKNYYLKELNTGLVLYNQLINHENRGEKADWSSCLGNLIQSEYMDKVNEIQGKIDWFQYSRNWQKSTELSYYAFLSYVTLNRLSEAKIWRDRLETALNLISVENIKPEYTISPNTVRLFFKLTESSSLSPKGVCNVFLIMKEIGKFRLSALPHEKSEIIKPYVNIIDKTYDFLYFWINDKINFDVYVHLRKDIGRELINELIELNKLQQNEYDNERTKKIIGIIRKIESRCLSEILGQDRIKFHLPS